MKSKVHAALATLFTLGCTTMATPAFAGDVVYQDNYDTGLVCTGSAAANAANYCFQSKGVWHEVSTPSGNYSYTFNGSSFISVTNYDATGKVAYSNQTSFDAHEKMLFKSGQAHNGHSFTQTDIVTSSAGTCQTVTVEYDYGFANGNVTQNNFMVSATPC